MSEGSELHKVLIDVGKRFCEISPGDLFVHAGDSVVFVNETGARVLLLFGNRALFDREQIEIKAGGSSDPLTVGRIPPPRSFQYAVYSDQTGAFGVGGSSPRIILNQ